MTTTFNEAAGWVPPADPAPVTLTELRAHQPGDYASRTPATTISRVPPVASRGAKNLWLQLLEVAPLGDPGALADVLDVIAEHDPRDVMDLRWAWKVKAPLE